MKSRQKILLEERQGRISKDLPLTFSRPIFGECLLFMEHLHEITKSRQNMLLKGPYKDAFQMI